MDQSVLLERLCAPKPESTSAVAFSWSLLGLDPGTNDAASAKRQFRQLSLLVHPDKCSDPSAAAAFQALHSALETVCMAAVAAGVGSSPTITPEFRARRFAAVMEQVKHFEAEFPALPGAPRRGRGALVQEFLRNYTEHEQLEPAANETSSCALSASNASPAVIAPSPITATVRCC